MRRAPYFIALVTILCSTHLHAASSHPPSYLFTEINCSQDDCSLKKYSSSDCFNRAKNCYLSGELIVGYSYREDNFSFKSEDLNGLKTSLKIDDVTTHQISGQGFLTNGNFYFRGQVNSGWIFGGTAKKREIAWDLDFFAYRGDVDGCIVLDLSAGVGYLCNCMGAGVKFIPLVGYSWSRQNLEISNLKIVTDYINELLPGTTITNFKEYYILDWHGPWIGFDLLYDYYVGWKLYSALEFHWASVTNAFSTNSTNLGFITFEHQHRHENGCGSGFVAAVGASFDICCNWTLVIMANYQAWNLWHGCGRDQDRDLVKTETLHRNSWYTTIGLAYPF